MKAWLLTSLLLMGLAVAGSLVVWNHREAWLPELVPTHWGPSGKPDAFTPRDGMLFPLLLVPGLMLLMIGIALVIPWLSPIRFRIEPFRPTYDFIMALIVAMFAYLHFVILAGYTQTLVQVDRWITCGMLLFIAALGNVMGKVKRNFYVGIRTPWTLASDLVWDRTHRLGAWMFVGGGLVGCLLVLVGVWPLLALGVFGVAAIVPVIYSLVLYKQLERQGRLNDQQGA
ncbi:MAG: SdpI family protein [Gemmataceae bacterium]